MNEQKILDHDTLFCIAEDTYADVVACGEEETLRKIRELCAFNGKDNAKKVVCGAIWFLHELTFSKNEKVIQAKHTIVDALNKTEAKNEQ